MCNHNQNQNTSPTSALRIPRRGQFTARIIEQSGRNEHYRRLVVEFSGSAAPCIANTKPGQFIQIACRDFSQPRRPTPLLRRPFSVSRISAEPQSEFQTTAAPNKNSQSVYLEILYRLIGPGTQWLANCPQGHNLDIIGPLGNGFTLPADNNQKCILVGGGIGLPPMFFLADQLERLGFKSVLGFAGERTKDRFGATLDFDHYDTAAPLRPQKMMLELARSQTPCIITTDDGSAGFKGHVVAALEGFLNQNPDWQAATIFVCGPMVMMKGTASLADRFNMACQACLEAYMSCGIGLCQSCATPVLPAADAHPNDNTNSEKPQTEYKLVCTNGPVFDAKKINWALL